MRIDEMAGCWKPALGRIKPSGVPFKWTQSKDVENGSGFTHQLYQDNLQLCLLCAATLPNKTTEEQLFKALAE